MARLGFHSLIIVTGLAVAANVWNIPRGSLTFQDTVAAVADEVLDGPLDEVEMPVVELVAAPPTAEPLKPLVRRIAEGDTLRAIAAEYSVSISTILASNPLDDPDLIVPGQELLIPPVDGLVAEVEAGETLVRLAERLGADPSEIARANALPPDLEQTLSPERLIVPGREPAERAVRPGRKPTASAVGPGEGDASDRPRVSGLFYEVQDGDTLGQISAQFGVSIWTLLNANNFTDPDSLAPGTKLKVLPVNGVEHEVQSGESLLDVASYYEVDVGSLIDFNALAAPDSLTVGDRLVVPGTERAQPGISLAALRTPAAPVVARADAPPTARESARPAPAAQPSQPSQGVAAAQKPAVQTTLAQAAPAPRTASQQTAAQPQAASKPQASAQPRAASKPQAPTTAQSQPPNRLAAAAITPPVGIPGGGSAGLLAAAMQNLGARYVWGGTAPSGFDCSGFVWYVHKAGGRPVSRALEGQLGGGPRIARDALQPGDTVFFQNTYKPGLSHNGIYIGGGRFIHASDELSGVKISNLSDPYWGPRYVGATRLW